MNRLSTLGIVLSLSLAFSLFVHACGEDKNPCQKLRGIQKGMCDDLERDCLPCACLIKDQDFEIRFLPGGGIDVQNSGCVDSKPCEGSQLEEATSCLEQENYCDPCFHPALEINVCDPVVFPDFCTGDW